MGGIPFEKTVVCPLLTTAFSDDCLLSLLVCSGSRRGRRRLAICSRPGKPRGLILAICRGARICALPLRYLGGHLGVVVGPRSAWRREWIRNLWCCAIALR